MKKIIFFAVLVLVGVTVWASSLTKSTTALQPLSLALDWTPNTNHTGIYVALHEGWYVDAGIEVHILPYADAVSPDVLVYSEVADIGFSSPESIVAASAAQAPVVSIAAINAHNTSSLVVRADSDITRPSHLDGKIYGGFGAPFEKPVVGTMIQNDGGRGVFTNMTLGVDSLEALRGKRIDVAWIFDGWQGIAAKRQDISLRTFPIREYGVPDYPTPVLITSPGTLADKKELLRTFIKVTARGYEYARIHPQEAAQMLIDAAPLGTFPDEGLVFESQEYLSTKYADKGKGWGFHDESFADYVQFMLEHDAALDTSGAAVDTIDASALYTNELLR